MISAGYDSNGCRDTEITMLWAENTRAHHERRCPRYANDLADAEGPLIEPLMPLPNRCGLARTAVKPR